MKKLAPKIIAAVILLAGLNASAQEARFGIGIPLITQKNVSADLEIQSRIIFSDDRNVTKNMATLSLEYDINNHLELGGSYRLTVKNKSSKNLEGFSMFQDESQRFTLDLTYKTRNYNQYRFKNKLRYQISDFDKGIEKSYLRNKSLIYYKLSKNSKPYGGLELIYRLEKHKFSGLRIHIGNKVKIYNKDVTGFFIIDNEFKNLPINLTYIAGLRILL